MKEYLKIFLTFLKIGAFSFGGGYAMVLLIQREVVDKEKWIDVDEFLPMLALAQSAPGPMVVNTAIIIGYRIKKSRGAFVASMGAILPSFVIMLVIALFFSQISSNEVVERIFKGIRPAVVSLILVPVIMFAKKIKRWNYVVSLSVAVAIFYGVSPLLIILGGIIVGVAYAYINRKKLTQ